MISKRLPTAGTDLGNYQQVSQQATTTDQHAKEVASGERFEFGKNWAEFLKLLNDDRIRIAEESVQDMLESKRLDGLSFIDVGCGSGFSACRPPPGCPRPIVRL